MAQVCAIAMPQLSITATFRMVSMCKCLLIPADRLIHGMLKPVETIFIGCSGRQWSEIKGNISRFKIDGDIE
jgi:hypothetical protein